MRALNQEERKKFYSNLDAVLSECETFCSQNRDKIVGKDKNDKELLCSIIEESKQRKEKLLNLKELSLNILKKNNIYTYSLDFYEYDKKLKKRLNGLNNLIECCDNRLKDIVPLEESMTECEKIRVMFPSDEQVKSGICKISGADTFDKFLQTKKFKCTKQAVLYHVRKKDLVTFLNESKEVLTFVSNNIEYTRVQLYYRLFLSGSHTDMEKEISELHKKYLEVQDKRDIADDHVGK